MAALLTHHDLATLPQLHMHSLPSRSSNDNEVDVDQFSISLQHDSDSEKAEDDDEQVDADATSIIGVSISRVQDKLRSPTTPAATKAQVLDASRSYFEAEPDGQTHHFEDRLEEKTAPVDEAAAAGTKKHTDDIEKKLQSLSAPQSNLQPSSPPRVQLVNHVQEKPEKRSSLVSSILGSTTNNTRQRSLSGSSIVDGIKKRLPSFPTFPLPKFAANQAPQSKILALTLSGTVRPNPEHRDATTQPGEEKVNDSPSPVDLGVANSSPALPSINLDGTRDHDTTKPAKRLPLRRATSDHSLYLRRSATGASDFDDYTAFADQSGMVNSRFKAITDSFQDSSLRRPKLLSISDTTPRDRSDSDETKQNTKRNAESLQSPSVSPGRQVSAFPNFSTSNHPILKEALSRMTGDLVIMGGYRGSILREAQPPNRQLWVPIKVGMNLRKADLEVGLTRDDEMKMEEKIIADGTLSHIGPVDICRRLIKKCRRSPNVQSGRLAIHDYGYDWRLSPDLLSDRLLRFLESLPCNRPDIPIEKRGAWLISHSLGGVITRHVINRCPELIAGVVYAGTPQNCVNILGPLRNGDDVLFSSRVLTAQVNFTLRTSYVLLPQNGRCFINKQSGERYDVDFFDAKSWDEYRLSPCIKAPLCRQRQKQNEEKRTSLMASLSEAMSQPTKHIPWFSSITTPIRNGSDASQKAKDKVEHTAENVAEAAAEAKPERTLSPTMADGQSNHCKPSIATTSTIPLPAATEYLSRTLTAIRRFKDELAHKQTLQARNAYPPSAVLFAKNTPTVYGAFVNSREDIKYDDAFDDLAFAAGDGVVLASAAQMPNGYRCVKGGRVESDRGHVGLLGDLEGVGRCLGAVLDARQCGVGTVHTKR